MLCGAWQENESCLVTPIYSLGPSPEKVGTWRLWVTQYDFNLPGGHPLLQWHHWRNGNTGRNGTLFAHNMDPDSLHCIHSAWIWSPVPGKGGTQRPWDARDDFHLGFTMGPVPPWPPLLNHLHVAVTRNVGVYWWFSISPSRAFWLDLAKTDNCDPEIAGSLWYFQAFSRQTAWIQIRVFHN